MILPLRRRHRRIVAVLAVVLPVGFVAGLAVRDPIDPMDALPAVLLAKGEDLPDAVHVLPAPIVVGSEAGAQARVTGVRARDGRAWLDLEVDGDLLHPGLLLYWSLEAAKTDGLPEGARLLGALGAHQTRSLPLPTPALAGDGYLMLYSLGHHAVVGPPASLGRDLLATAVAATDGGTR